MLGHRIAVPLLGAAGSFCILLVMNGVLASPPLSDAAGVSTGPRAPLGKVRAIPASHMGYHMTPTSCPVRHRLLRQSPIRP